jgi:hypothetical protein
MKLNFNFVADQVLKGRIYPALARHQARPYTQAWREFGEHFPYTIPLRLQEYCNQHSVDINIYSVNDQLPDNTFYPVGLGFFDFSIDYFTLLPTQVFQAVYHGQIRVLFYYHEGDNPQRIKQRLDMLAAQLRLPPDCYVFVSSNSAAERIPGFVTFNDFELWYYQRNIETDPLPVHHDRRTKEFTCLSRLHKWWRATAMADLHRTGILDNSYWSYCESATGADTDCPIEVDMIARLRHDRTKFLEGAPYVSDELSDSDRNNHAVMEPKYYMDSYCQIVLESQFDVDQSGGAFVTEKTFKPIKHGQLFFVAGGPGSLQVLRDLGYRTFDHLLDNSYDTITNHTQRWQRLQQSIAEAQPKLPELFAAAHADIEHNQQLFVANKRQRLNSLLEKINEQHC